MATLNTLVNFVVTDALPAASLIEDSSGNLYGTTEAGGTNDAGTVFEIPFANGSYATSPTIVAKFDGVDGQSPEGSLYRDSAGNLFGTTAFGGADSHGTVFEIPFTAGSYASTPTTLITFNSTNGSTPTGGLIADANGDLFGTTDFGGSANHGTVFEIAKTGGVYASTPTTLVSFTGTNGSDPLGNLVADASGNLFGTTDSGGAGVDDGTVFEIAFSGGTYASTPTTLVSFNGTNGSHPEGALTFDAAGDIFSTTFDGGANGDGTVFEIVKTGGVYASTPTVLVNFSGTDGKNPEAGVLRDAAGNLFGTTNSGGTPVGSKTYGTVYEVPFVAGSYASAPTTLYSFSSTDGANPEDALIADGAGNLFGTTLNGGSGSDGTAFELTGTGFQVTCYRRGTRIATPAGEAAVETLAIGDLVITETGEAVAISWVGQRHVDCRRHPRPEAVWPVRVRAGAFGEGLPCRDLWLSPDHAVFVEEVLIPVKHLLNGTSIAQEAVDEVTYFHIELPSHDVMLADGLPCESYLDTGDRFRFDNCDRATTAPSDLPARIWELKGRAPLVVTGPALQAARRRVSATENADQDA